jgi:uncharacterized protein YydD (DUF2326 family)
MFLKNLIIKNDDIIIRDIEFKKGINLIVDETSSSDRKSSGNSVGKTTVLRLIDYCLDGDGKNIYMDPEFKTTNSNVESFLKDNNVSVLLTLIEDIDDKTSPTIEIERNFLARSRKVQSINGIQYNISDFSKELKRLIFKTDSEHPSFRQLISKNIRDEKHKLVNTIRVLAPNVVTDSVYETLHLFWLGIDINQSKDKLTRDKNLEERLQTRLRRESNLPQIRQSLIVVNNRIAELERKKDSFNLNEEYESDLAELNQIRQKITMTSSRISRLELRKELINESKENLERDVADIDIAQIGKLYEQAKVLIPNLQKTFSETVHFYNTMIGKNIEFITEELPALSEELKSLGSQLQHLLKYEKILTSKIRKKGAIDELNDIITEITDFYEKKGNLEEQKKTWETSQQNLRMIEEKLAGINDEIGAKDTLIQERISQFNRFFSDISERLDGKLSILSTENREGIYRFSVSNIEGNPGTGSKKSQMASFDLAYIKFADSLDIPCLHFILQDQIENVHSNQITNLLTEIVSEVHCQYVLPVLRDKLPSDIDIDSLEVLSLSQKDRLFRI